MNLGLSLISFNVLPFQISDPNHSLDDLEEEESYVLPLVKETQELQEDALSAPQVVRCGGEDGENGRSMSQRQRLNADMQYNSLVRRGRGKTLQGSDSSALANYS